MEFREVYKNITPRDSIYLKYHLNYPLEVLRGRFKLLDRTLIKWTQKYGFKPPSQLLSKSSEFNAQNKEGSFLHITFNKEDTHVEMIVFLADPELSKITIYNDLMKEVKLALNTPSSSKKMPERIIPAGSYDTITAEDINSGDAMVDFHDEYKHGRFYKDSTFYKLDNKNPITRIPIVTHSKYTAKVTSGGRRRTRKHRKTRKTRKH